MRLAPARDDRRVRLATEIRRPPGADVLLAAVLSAVGVVALLAQPVDPGQNVTRAADVAGVLLSLGMTGAVAWRRAAPLPSLGAAGVCALVASTSGYGVTVGALSTWMLLGSAALHTDRTVTRALIVLGAVSVSGSVAVFSPESRTVLGLVSAAGVGTLPPLVGDALRRQRELTDRVRALQDAEVERATAAERVRIARDVHDSVGHHLSAISLQSRAGELGDEAAAVQALRRIARLSERALDDTHHILGILRDDDAPGLSPAPRLGDLDELAATAALAGVEVAVEREGALDPLPDPIHTCAFRIAQEALTNVARHAAPARAVLRVERARGRVMVTVTDDGRAARGPAAEGRGITGMRERAHAVGGSLRAAPRAGGGWAVHAELPDHL